MPAFFAASDVSTDNDTRHLFTEKDILLAIWQEALSNTQIQATKHDSLNLSSPEQTEDESYLLLLLPRRQCHLSLCPVQIALQ
mmetsp:Transcript_15755/g.36041  ORF Transcript_15755/g.36041 Transcript_15755/m.36041 type:complete len:83 (+) Transcript_15755:179-427(+)